MAPLSPQARRWRTIILTVPIIGATSLVLYERLVLGKPRRMLPRNDPLSDGKLLELRKAEPTAHEDGTKDAWDSS
ncbi:hypothetical protein OBBRIDRAFT_731287 [Obba rivulosa]|uniref:Uncharacterized protein n=1 Tax=Obba rivulosa TaxID=1052685 RepID=A0A8E2B2Q1_9APHY|nr:hypothetical protein OBBRIDRAFT_731287 [Obba rivulosa]